MDGVEARLLLGERLATYRAKSYEQLRELIHRGGETFEVRGPSGSPYQVEICAVWDDKAGGEVRVIGAIDDGGIRAFAPLTDSFIMTPDGSFVGE